jgi:hypothetical protein
MVPGHVGARDSLISVFWSQIFAPQQSRSQGEPTNTKTIPRTPHTTEMELRRLCHMVSILEPRDTSTFPADTVAGLQDVGPFDGEDWVTDADEDGIDEDGADEEVGSDDDLSFDDDDGFRLWPLYRLTESLLDDYFQYLDRIGPVPDLESCE